MAADTQIHAQPGLGVVKSPAIQVRLLGGFELSRAGQPILLPLPAQRLVAFLALQEDALPRARVAGTLWLETTQERALANLRSAVWRLRQRDDSLLEITFGNLGLVSGIHVDARAVAANLCRLIDDSAPCYEDVAGIDVAIDVVTKELLPDWFDEWVLFERERLRQLRVHALEALTRRLSNLGRHAQAIQAGMSLVRQEPLRESAHGALIEAHLAEGNRNEALRQYESYREIMRDELGLDPSLPLSRLLERILSV